ncbi:MAG TPA: DUF6065 family protein [Gaiellaceae bacterium]
MPERGPTDDRVANVQENGAPDSLELLAFSFTQPLLPISPAARRRAWMDEAKDHWPNRCLPLLIANESGWTIPNPISFTATWNGDESPEGVRIEFSGEHDPQPPPVVSHFGFGVITWAIPYVFRTPPGYNLLARGPANLPKDGIWPLEGIVETDWAVANFTMNWKLTRIDHSVSFEAGEPFCMIVPQRRGELEAFEPRVRQLESEPGLASEFELFAANRQTMQINKFLSKHVEELESYKTDWEGHYYRGLAPSGRPAQTHQTRVSLKKFRADAGQDGGPADR